MKPFRRFLTEGAFTLAGFFPNLFLPTSLVALSLKPLLTPFTNPVSLKYQKIFNSKKEVIGAAFFCFPSIGIRYAKYLLPEERMLFDYRCFEQIIKATKEWRKRYKAFVNIFPESWSFKSFTAYVYSLLKKNKPQNLVFEILESSLPDGIEEIFKCFKRRFGVQFALDDFGSENASLTRLDVFSFADFIKIDKQILWNDNLFEISKGLIKKLGKQKNIIFEGVETSTHLEKIENLNLNSFFLQGFFLHKPAFFNSL
jgi:hypothetical protein